MFGLENGGSDEILLNYDNEKFPQDFFCFSYQEE